MKKFISICCLLLLMTFNVFGGNCLYKIYNSKNKSAIIKFDCDNVSPFYVSVLDKSGQIIDGFLYKPSPGENVFMINFSNLTDSEFVIEINYSGEKSQFLFVKK